MFFLTCVFLDIYLAFPLLFRYKSNKFKRKLAEALYNGQTSDMKLFAKLVNCLKPLTYKNLHLNCLRVSKYVSDVNFN